MASDFEHAHDLLANHDLEHVLDDSALRNERDELRAALENLVSYIECKPTPTGHRKVVFSNTNPELCRARALLRRSAALLTKENHDA